MKRAASVLAIVSLAAAGPSCSHDWSSFEATGGSGGGSGAGGSDTTTTGTSGGAKGGNGGSAGSSPKGVCGDGILDEGEECDDGNTQGDDGCTNCQVDCNTDAGSFKDPKTHHCYWILRLDHSFDIERQNCMRSGHGEVDSAALSTQAELDFIQPHLTQTLWTGGRWMGSWQWTNGEQWNFGDDQTGAMPPWTEAENDKHSSLDCVSVQPSGKIKATGCGDLLFVLCERSPSIAKK